MKTNFKGLSMLFILTVLALNLNGQSYDCNTENSTYRTDKNTWIAKDVDKPFSAADRTDFSGLFYYPVDCKFVFTGTLSSVGSMKIVNVETSKGGTVQLYDYGVVSVDIAGKTYHLTAYKNIDLPEFSKNTEAIFIPIKDESSEGNLSTTFANGRYLVVQPPASGNQVILDFNLATNPFENYNPGFSSIKVPNGNIINAPLTTGERKYEDR